MYHVLKGEFSMKITKVIFALVIVSVFVVNIRAFSIADELKSIFGGEKNADEPPISEDITPPRGDRAPSVDEMVEITSASADNWYFRHTKDGVRPPVPAEMSYISKHNGYYLGPDEKVIYLTFDAGYENGNVEKILDTLRDEGVPGAFFILEHLACANTDLVKRMADEGHTVCNHTASHKDMTKLQTKEEFAAELSKMEQIYKDNIGYDLAKFYRPPEGRLSEKNLTWADELGYKTVMWSFAHADWDNANQPNPDTAIKKILAETHNGEIILLHPTSATNAEILPTLIREWKKMGYRFGTLDELGA